MLLKTTIGDLHEATSEKLLHFVQKSDEVSENGSSFKECREAVDRLMGDEGIRTISQVQIPQMPGMPQMMAPMQPPGLAEPEAPVD